MRVRTTKAELARLVELIHPEAVALKLIGPRDTLRLEQGERQYGIPYRLHVTGPDIRGWHRFTPADGDGGALGLTAKEAARTLKVIYDTLRAVRMAQREPR